MRTAIALFTAIFMLGCVGPNGVRSSHASTPPKDPPQPAKGAESEPSGHDLLMLLYMLDIAPDLSARRTGDGVVIQAQRGDSPQPHQYHPCPVNPTTTAPKLPPVFAKLAAEQAERFKTEAVARKASERALGSKKHQEAWHAALAYEHLHTPKPALNPGLLLVAEREGWLTPEQCGQLLPYLRKARGYKLHLDRQRKQGGQDYTWINTPDWAHTCWAIKGCEETIREAAAP